MPAERVAVLSDVHFPFQDDTAVALALRVVAHWQPHRVVLNGDMLDMYAVSHFDKNPKRLEECGLQAELDQFAAFCGHLRAAVPMDTAIDFLPGNHEARLEKWLWRNSGIYGLHALELPTLLGLKAHGIAYHEREVALAEGNLIVKHGRVVRKAAGYSAHGELEMEKYAVSTVTGHTHRLASVFVQTRRGVVGGWENGCLCNLNPEYIEHPNWQQGMTLCRVDGDRFAAQSVPFLGRGASMKAMIDGQEVRV